VPVHVIDAPVAGSGKSYLLSTVSWIATGQAMPALGAGKSEEELGKRLDAAVITGQPLICIDNVVGEIGGEAICRLTEQWRPQVRILGQTQLVNVDARGISFFANGNNIVVLGDFCRRVIRCRLDTRQEHPELRQFKRNPMKEILGQRGAYIAAALTICRAYRAVGRPGRCRLGSYGDGRIQ
jgi:putative DNA primase/helicase